MKILTGAACATVLLASTLATSVAAQDARCLKLATFEWRATHTIDPARIVENSDFQHVISAYEFLTNYDNNFVVSPGLAVSWTSSADGREWVFKLREGVKFHSGKELTAEDAVYSLRRVKDPETASMGADELSALKSENIVAKSKYELQITFDQPVVEAPLVMGNKAMGIVEAGTTTEQLATDSYGTGPFVFRDLDPAGARSVGQAFADYWQPGKPGMPCIELSGIVDPLARVTAIQTGDTDIITSVDPVTLSSLEGDASVTLLTAENAMLYLFAMQTDQPPFDDNRVREALKLVIDREALAMMVTMGTGAAANDDVSPLSGPFAFSKEPLPQDIEKAKALLAEAGQEGLTVDLYTGAQDIAPGALIMAQAYKEMAMLAGITVNIVTVPNASYWDETYMKHPFFFAYWYGRHPSSAYNFGYRSGARFNETNWSNKAFDAVLDKAAAETDTAARAEAYKEAGKLLSEEGGAIIPLFSSVVAVTRSNCSGYVAHIESRAALADVVCK